MLKYKVAAELKEAMKKSGMDQTSLFEKTRIAKSTISKIEHAHVEVCLNTLDRLADAMDMEVDIKFKKKAKIKK